MQPVLHCRAGVDRYKFTYFDAIPPDVFLVVSLVKFEENIALLLLFKEDI